jgi:serine/threonine protein kinase
MGPEAETIPPGTLVAGRYRVLHALGEGGMGAVYAAEQLDLERAVALKVLHPRRITNPEAVSRFLREARTAAALRHPGIVEVYDLGRDDGLGGFFIAMELLEGEELSRRIERVGRLSVPELLRIGDELCDAVSAAHEAGVIHRDLKPANVFLARAGRGEVVKVLDFGIAKLTRESPMAALTKTGDVFGTPLYMSPEQLGAARDVDARSDVYAIGAMLFECAVGHPPYVEDSLPALVLQVTSQPHPDLATLRPELPPALVSLVHRALEKNREERPESAEAMGAALRELRGDGRFPSQGLPTGPASRDASFLEETLPATDPPALIDPTEPPPPPPRRRRALALGLLGAGAVAAFAYGFAPGPTPPPAPPLSQNIPRAEVRIETDVPATVRFGEDGVCPTTPCAVDVTGGEIPVVVRAPGYAELRRRVGRADGPVLALALEPLQGPAPALVPLSGAEPSPPREGAPPREETSSAVVRRPRARPRPPTAEPPPELLSR